VSGVNKDTNKGGIAHNKHCLAPECGMKKIPGKDWGRHVKNEIHGGKPPEHRRCNGEGCISCEEAKEMKKKKSKYFCHILVATPLCILVGTLCILVGTLCILVGTLCILVGTPICAIYHF
jgi:hypothetical protein